MSWLTKQSGFSLPELIAVLVIVAALGATAVARFSNNTAFELQSSRDQIVSVFITAQQLAMVRSETIQFSTVGNQITILQDGTNVQADGISFPQPLGSGQSITSAIFDFNRLGQTQAATLVLTKGSDSVAIAVATTGFVQ